MRTILLFVILSLVLFSCETDFDTTADWKDITVVYGLLDQKDSLQYIKINKAFLGEGDALMFAKVEDSVNYSDTLNVWLEEWDQNGNKLQTIQFEPTITYKPDDPNAVFSTGAQRVYKGAPATVFEVRPIYEGQNIVGYQNIWFNDANKFKLFIQYPDSSKLITSETIIVQDFIITKPFPGSTSIRFVPNPANTTTFSWNTAPNDDKRQFRYEFHLIFNYSELKDNDTLYYKSLVLASGQVYPQGGASELFYYYKDNNFFTSCINNIPYDDPAVEEKIKERYTGKVQVLVYAAASEFNLFMQVYEPSTSIIQEKPTYTNIENGIGIFSARYNTYQMKKLHTETVADLKQMNYNEMKFVY